MTGDRHGVTPPVAVEVRRGGRVESRHRLSVAVLRPDGRIVLAAGELDEPIYPRSAIKPFQALPLVESGAADRFHLSSRELALACASHSGEEGHVEAVRAWLLRLGLDETALACGPRPPLSAEVARRLIARGEEPSPLHDNCSGKHAGMLTLARHLGVPETDYVHPHHPVQRRIRDVLSELTGHAVVDPPGIDGCTAPNWPIPLRALARAAARFATGADLPPARMRAAARLIAACRAEPWYLAGTGRAGTRIVAVLADGLVKSGAEGVYLGFFPKAGLGLALKVEDGAGRASEVALVALLDSLQLFTPEARRALADLAQPQVLDSRGRRVGEIVPAADFPPIVGRKG
ncbi:hypothetical protein HRbin40_01979 [bacterium HR40]|nr:hypothetical protein HRbin40_01979 [bacterium HR40]